jgi:hypothetical protein
MIVDNILLIANGKNDYRVFDVYTTNNSSQLMNSYIQAILDYYSVMFKVPIINLQLQNGQFVKRGVTCVGNVDLARSVLTDSENILDTDKMLKIIKDAEKVSAKQCKLLTTPIKQIDGTCWFNSVVNGMLAGEHFQKIILCKYVNEQIGKRFRVFKNLKFNTFKETNSCSVFTKETFLEKLMEIQQKSESTLNQNVYRKDVQDLIKETSMKPKPLVFVDGWISSDALKQVLKVLELQATYLTYQNYLNKSFPSDVQDILIITPNSGITFKVQERITEVLQVNNNVYILDHANIYITFSMFSRHYVTGLPKQSDCVNVPFLYDSVGNTSDAFVPFDWMDATIANVKTYNPYKTLANRYTDKIKDVSVGYLVYVHENITKKFCVKHQ